MVNSYNQRVEKPNATMTNFQTHETVQNTQIKLKNRAGYNFKRCTAKFK